MTQQSTPPRKAFCLTTNDNYRTAILTLCKISFNKSKTPFEFTEMMDTLTHFTSQISDYPSVDQTFMHGATLAFLTAKRWTQ